jgi:serine/threonine protein kinase
MKIKNFVVRKRLGAGTFSEVFEAVHKTTGQPVAIKMIDKNRIKSAEDMT